MPHSTQTSVESNGTFDLTSDARPKSSHSDRTVQSSQSRVHARVPSNSFGIAVTSGPFRDERASLPSQRDSVLTAIRNSGPTTPAADAGTRAGGNNANAALIYRKAGDRSSMRSYSSNDVSRRGIAYHEEQVQNRDSGASSTKAKVPRQSPVIAELKTNVIIKDEFTLVTDLSYHLARRYTRPEANIMVKIDHSACLAFGGSFDPCYFLTIHAIPSQMGPAANKRNSGLIQQFMADILSVPSDRGIVTFVAIPEENLAMDGSTVMSESEQLDKKKNPQAIKSALKDASRNGVIANKKSTSDLDRASKTSDSVAASSASEEEKLKKPPAQEHSSSGSEDSTAERPRTTQSVKSTDQSQNGLRMNGVSADAEQASRTSRTGGRPASVIGAPSIVDQPVKAAPSQQVKEEPPQQVKKEPLQPTQKPILQNVRPLPQAVAPWEAVGPPAAQIVTKIEPQRAKHIPLQVKQISDPIPLAPRPIAIQDRASSLTSVSTPVPNGQPTKTATAESRQKNTYLDNVSTLTNKIEPRATVTEDKSVKRRSTITATPKLPQVPPSPNLKEESKSISSRLSKRKSFIKIFKRETVPPWYKQ